VLVKRALRQAKAYAATAPPVVNRGAPFGSVRRTNPMSRAFAFEEDEDLNQMTHSVIQDFAAPPQDEYLDVDKSTLKR